MRPDTQKQLKVLAVLLVVYAALAAVAFLLSTPDELAAPGQSAPATISSIPRWELALANGGIALVIYAVFGLAAVWLARRLDIPAVLREGAGWRSWILWPMLLGLAVGVIMVAADVVLSDIGSTSGFPHPAFPLSIVSSAAAGIGEEILFRGFVMGLWGLLLMALLRRRVGRPAVLWIANGLAALAFSAGHLPGVMFLLQAATPAEIPAPVLVEVFVLNSLLGLIAGARSARDGLVAAMGVHFWGDVVWHVVWPLM